MPVSPTVLVLGSYPCVKPMHGGQIRLAKILQAYRQAGFQTQSVNVYCLGTVSEPRGPNDIDYPGTSAFRQWRGRAVPLVDDLTSGHFIAGEQSAYQKATSKLPASPLIIHLEQPWLFPLIQRWRQEGVLGEHRLIYGSQNVEAPLKRAILKQYRVAEADAVAEDIASLEAYACREADIVLAVSESDRQALSRLSDTPVILAENGIEYLKPTAACLEYWRRKLPQNPFAVFVASAHPPNISGFFDSLGDSLGFLAPDQRICVVGSVGAQILEHPSFKRWQQLNESRIQVIGMIEDADLAAVRSLAHVFILPISEGGGSNLKTAEALYSGKHVLGTETSFRGYDKYHDMPGVHIARMGGEFRRLLNQLLDTPLHEATQDLPWQEIRKHLLWTATLQPMVDAAKVLAGNMR